MGKITHKSFFIKLNRKLRFLQISFGVVLFFIFFRAFFLQIWQREKFISYLNSQVLRTEKSYPQRGGIYDRNGYPLAINKETYALYTFPHHLKDHKKFLASLGEIIPVLTKTERRSLFETFKTRKRHTWIVRKIELSSTQLELLKKIEGVYIEKEMSRFYPNGPLALGLVGAVNIDNQGASGIEQRWDQILKGTPTTIRYSRDAKGRPIKSSLVEAGEKSQSLYLTIDKDIQEFLELSLQETIFLNKAEGGGAIVMDSRSGEILGMASYSQFLNNQNQGQNQNQVQRQEHKNEVSSPLSPSIINFYDKYRSDLSLLSSPFEPGSIFKAITIAIALEKKIVQKGTRIFAEEGQLKIGKHTIGEADAKKIPLWPTVTEIMKYSSNIGTAKIAFLIGEKEFKEKLQEFELNEKTGVDLAGESRGILDLKNKWDRLRLATISFGQGVALTPLQMLKFYNAITNEGILVPPTVVRYLEKESLSSTLELQSFSQAQIETEVQNKGKRIFSPNVAKELQTMLIKTVEDGTGLKAQIPYFTVAAKTSTAQKVSSTTLGYEGYIASMAGMPLNVKRPFTVLVYIDAPKGKSYYGGTVAAPLFQKITEYVLYKNQEYEALPGMASDEITKKLENHALSESFDDAFVEESLNIQVSSAASLWGNEKSSQNPSLSEIKTEINEIVIPDFKGLDKTQSRKLAQKYNLKILEKGMGLVHSQFPSAGVKYFPGMIIRLYYRSPHL